MKKIFTLTLVCVMLAGLISADAEDSSSNLPGDWYSNLKGIPIEMTLGEDQTCQFRVPGYNPEPEFWEEQEGYIYLNHEEEPELDVLEEKLLWMEPFAFFAREKEDTYTPAEVKTELEENCLDGYWKCAYVDVDGEPYPASAINDQTDLYADGTSVILGGPVFGDTPVEMENEKGALVCRTDNLLIQMQLQEDGFMRLSLAVGDENLVWYLIPATTASAEI